MRGKKRAKKTRKGCKKEKEEQERERDSLELLIG